MIALSVLIPSINCRKDYLSRIRGILEPQLTPEAELVTLVDDGDISIGAKRNRLIDLAKGSYIVFVDDDDLVAASYVESILGALKSQPDCVGFKVKRTIDGREWGEQENSLRFRDETFRQDDNRIGYWGKRIGHLNPVRIELARAVGFKYWNNYEDTDYAERLQPLLSSEIFIDEFLYTYEFRSNKEGKERTHKERYHLPSISQAEYRYLTRYSKTVNFPKTGDLSYSTP